LKYISRYKNILYTNLGINLSILFLNTINKYGGNDNVLYNMYGSIIAFVVLLYYHNKNINVNKKKLLNIFLKISLWNFLGSEV